MPKTYITFGQAHVHSVNGKTFDKDCVAAIECTDEKDGRDKAMEIFNGIFHQSYYEDQLTSEIMAYYPRGIINVD